MPNRPIKIKIDVSKIEKQHLYKGSKGTYLDAVIWMNKDGPGQYGDNAFIVQEVSREQREAGVKGKIIGNATVPDNAEAPPRRDVRPPVKQQTQLPVDDDDSEIPF